MAYLELICKYDSYGVRKGINVDPFAMVLNLKPSNSILREQGQ